MEDKVNPTIKTIEEFTITEHIDTLPKKFYHFSVSMKEHSFVGSGSSESRSLALKIAINECLERNAFLELLKKNEVLNTNGFAAHDSEERARESSVCEVLERDAVLISWLSKRAPFWIESAHLSKRVKQHLTLFETKGLEIKFGILAILNKRYCCVGYLKGDSSTDYNFGVTLSSSSSKELDIALLSILKDLRKALLIIESRRSNKLPCFLNDFEKQKFKNSAQYHFEYYLDPKNYPKIAWFIGNSESYYEESDITISSRRVFPKIIPPWSFYVFLSSSKNLQNFFLGPFKEENINFERLKRVSSSRRILNKELHYLP